MERTFESEGCVVFDNFLPEEQRRALFEYFRLVDFKFVHETRTSLPKPLQTGYKRAWRIDDGNALTSNGCVAFGPAVEEVPDAIRALGRKWAEHHETRFYPSGTPVDAFMEALRALALGTLSPWIGRAGNDWIAFVATPYIHQPGVGMSWHADQVVYTGAFSYFVHPEWDADYGGEFLIGDGSVADIGAQAWRNRNFDPLTPRFPDQADDDQDAFGGPTGGRFLMPLPNRLIVIKRGVIHKVNRVSPLAGSHVRASVTGFFLDTQVAQKALAA